MESNPPSTPLRPVAEVARLFFKLGTIGFGGPAATIAMMEEHCIHRQRWLSRQHFLDLLGMTNLIPGPNALELAIHLGLLRAGWLGFLLAGLGFILPGTLITLAFAWTYAQAGAVANLQPLLVGIRAAVLAVIAVSVWRLARSALKNVPLAVISLLVAAAALAGLNEIAVLFGGGILGMLWLRARQQPSAPGAQLAIAGTLVTSAAQSHPYLLGAAAGGLSAATATVPVWKLGLFFLKIGAVLYGTGYVLIAFLENGLVQQHGWITRNQLLDAVAIGQLTPGPLLSTATFIGYLLAGIPGALVATAAVFLPSFAFVAALVRVLPRMRKSPWASTFLDAINASALALMAVVAVKLGRDTLQGWLPWTILLVSATVSWRWKLNPAWLVLGGALAGGLAMCFA